MHAFTAFIIAFIAAFTAPPAPTEGGLFIDHATLDTPQVVTAQECFEPPMPDGTIPPCD